MGSSLPACLSPGLALDKSVDCPAEPGAFPEPAVIDDKDAAILDALAADSRAPLKAIAAAVGLSRSSVQERIARLVADGTIAGFSVRRGAEQKGARAYMLVATAGAQGVVLRFGIVSIGLAWSLAAHYPSRMSRSRHQRRFRC